MTTVSNDTPPIEATPAPEPAKVSRVGFMLRALQYRNYRLFFSGQIISLIGNWMTGVATGWLIYRLTGSALMLGVVGFAGQVPAFLLSPFAGVWVDRLHKHRLLVITQTLAMIQSFLLALLALTGHINIWHVLALSAFQGLINAFDMPGRQSFVVEMVEKKEDMSNAIALNSSMVNAARLIGPSVGGIIIAKWGEGWCFLIDGFSYLAVIVSLLMMHVVRKPIETKDRPNTWTQLKEGWHYVSTFKPIRAILTLLALVSLIGVPYSVLMPVFATKILHGNASTQGWMMASTGVGALSSALFLASRKNVRGLGKLIPVAVSVFGIGLVGFSFSTTLWLSMPLLVVTGGGFMLQMAASNTIVQTIVDNDKRGRVMSFYMMAFMGMAPFGSLLAGGLASRIGAPHTVLLCGLGCIAGAGWFATQYPSLREIVRPMYVEMGIIPEVAEGILTAAELTTPPEER